ncbi:hypothetical protein BOTBODRAFT_218245 [Botryobasidium botryosum FD-172 SS1]|uniref:Uncharacterized protein n=1 Tax=Botryobasidium botryosum (strain FD-172 SS1) TaxID=930990 RepID=A0A067MYD6_BOTB1|nr:hypothetical protein BOTBODRAFT_218245 [Botryobasidium botryosum FD-172 SS1]
MQGTFQQSNSFQTTPLPVVPSFQVSLPSTPRSAPKLCSELCVLTGHWKASMPTDAKSQPSWPRPSSPISSHAPSSPALLCQCLLPLSHSLPQFVAYSLRRARLHSNVTFAALFLLNRLKGHFSAARGSSGHRLFISAFMMHPRSFSLV